MQINSIDVPTSMNERGKYVFKGARVVGYNGQKDRIRVGSSSLTWLFDEIDDDEWEWLAQTLLGGEDSAEFSQCQLYDEDRVLTTFNHCKVYRPDGGEFLHGKHVNVTLEIVDIY